MDNPCVIRYTLAAVFLAAIALCSSCDNGSVVGLDPHAPSFSSDPYPADRAEDQPLSLILRWSCSDPDGDSLVYSVYLGTTIRPGLVADSLTDTVYYTGILAEGRQYYWRVVARDPDGHSMSSALWRFSTPTAGSSPGYPLAVGNRWQYSAEVYMHNVRPDTTSHLNLDTTHYTLESEIICMDTLSDERETYVFSHAVTYDSNTYFSGAWCNNLADGYYRFAHCAPKIILPFHQGGATTSLVHQEDEGFFQPLWPLEPIRPGCIATYASDDTMTYDNPPLKMLHYPPEIGRQWACSDPSQQYHFEKRVTRRLTVEVPAGSFDCFEIQALYNVDHEGNWDTDLEHFEYVASIGIVKTTFTVRNMVEHNYSNPGTSVTFDFTQESVLTAYQMK